MISSRNAKLLTDPHLSSVRQDVLAGEPPQAAHDLAQRQEAALLRGLPEVLLAEGPPGAAREAPHEGAGLRVRHLQAALHQGRPAGEAQGLQAQHRREGHGGEEVQVHHLHEGLHHGEVQGHTHEGAHGGEEVPVQDVREVVPVQVAPDGAYEVP